MEDEVMDRHENYVENMNKGLTLRVELEVYMDVPRSRVQACVDTDLDAIDDLEEIGDDLRVAELRDMVMESTQDIFDAMHDALERQDDIIRDVDIDRYNVKVLPRSAPALVRPDFAKGEVYSRPTPNMVSGLVKMGKSGIEPVEVSSVDALTDDQLQGAHFMLERVFMLRGMGRYQVEQLMELVSETNWAMMSRPTQHMFKPGPGGLCGSCGNELEGHAQPKYEVAEMQADTMPVCGDEFGGNTCEDSPGHLGDHSRETNAGTLTWSDPMDHPPGDEEE